MESVSQPIKRRRTRVLMMACLGIRRADLSFDLALLAIRVVLAWIFIYYGAGKLFGAFNGPGIHQTAVFFSETAHLNPGGFFAVFGGVMELGGGIALAFGFISRFVGLALFGDMVMAMITVTWVSGFNSASLHPGYELNIAIGVLALTVALVGAGRFSVDAIIGRRLEATDKWPAS